MGEGIDLAKFMNREDAQCRIVLNVEGVTEEVLARGVAAANAVFQATGVNPAQAANLNHQRNWPRQNGR